MDRRTRSATGSRGEAAHLLLIWALFGVNALAILITYARLPAADFYHVSEEGMAGGAGRALVFSNFPAALAAIALLGVATARLLQTRFAAPGRGRTALIATAAAATLLCLVTALPGVVEQGDLDAKPANVIPALGVLVALGITIAAVRRGDPPRRFAWTGRDRFGIVLIAVLGLVSLPWILADIGVYIDEIPILGAPFMGSEVPDGETLAAVHLGHHHGLDGLLFVVTALVLGRLLREPAAGRLVATLRWYLALMLAYGLMNIASDAWLEQVVKRGWTDHRIPDVLRPDLSLGWGVVLVGTALAWFLLFRADEADRLPTKVVAATA